MALSMLIPMDTLLMFLAAALAISLAPGPDMLFILANSLGQGTRAGLTAAFGMATGMLGHTAAAVLGLSALLAAAPVAFEIVRWAGAAYLVWLAIRSFRARSFGSIAAARHEPLGRVFRQAVITNLLNPKVAMFYLAFLPQFVEPARSAPAIQLLVLAALLILVGLIIDSAVGIAGGRVRTLVTGSGVFARAMGWIPGCIYLGLATRLALDARR
jgi:threonine/homoserine/homoserine lactone efflux protein